MQKIKVLLYLDKVGHCMHFELQLCLPCADAIAASPNPNLTQPWLICLALWAIHFHANDFEIYLYKYYNNLIYITIIFNIYIYLFILIIFNYLFNNNHVILIKIINSIQWFKLTVTVSDTIKCFTALKYIQSILWMAMNIHYELKLTPVAVSVSVRWAKKAEMKLLINNINQLI